MSHNPIDWTSTLCSEPDCDRERSSPSSHLCRRHLDAAARRRRKASETGITGRRCEVDGCSRITHAKNLCRLHYNRKITTGSTELKPRTPKAKPPCSIDECPKDAKTLGYCGSHYSNYRRHGVAVLPNRRGPRDEPKLDKFARHLTGDDELGCWLYSGIINQDGYGKFNVGQGRGEVKAHRWLYQELTGKTLTRAVQLDHSCEVRNCVRPSHLLEVSQAQHNEHTAARMAAPEGYRYRADESPRSLAEVGFAIQNKLPMIWNQ